VQGSSNGKRAVITGGAGFIGSHVIDLFLDEGYDVVAIDDLSTGSEANVAEQARLEQLDIVDAAGVERVISSFRPGVVCHLAAQASVTVSVEKPDRDLEVNVRGTLNVCEAARRAGARVVFASTGGALYGDDVPLPTPEEVRAQPLAPYGASKLAAEAYVATWGRLHGIENVVLRLGNVYGPRQSPHGEAGVVAIFSARLRAGEQPIVYGEGSPTRDYIHVSDVARAFLAAAEGGRGATYNVGWGAETSVSELLDTLQGSAGVSVEPRLEPLRPGELKRSALDSSRIVDELGWRPQVGLDEGLAATYASFAA
jgi:UDP-glucose 4-epimerase